MNEPDKYEAELLRWEGRRIRAREDFARAQELRDTVFNESAAFRFARSYKTEPSVGTRVRHVESRLTGVVTSPSQNDAERLAGEPVSIRLTVKWDSGVSGTISWVVLEPA